MKSTYDNDPILALQREANEEHLRLSTALERTVQARRIAAGIARLAEQHSFKAMVDHFASEESRMITRMVNGASGQDFHFDRGYVAALRSMLSVIRDHDKTIKELDRRIGDLKNQVGSSVNPNLEHRHEEEPQHGREGRG